MNLVNFMGNGSGRWARTGAFGSCLIAPHFQQPLRAAGSPGA